MWAKIAPRPRSQSQARALDAESAERRASYRDALAHRAEIARALLRALGEWRGRNGLAQPIRELCERLFLLLANHPYSQDAGLLLASAELVRAIRLCTVDRSIALRIPHQ